MKRKILAHLLALALCFSFAAQSLALNSRVPAAPLEGAESFTFLYFGDIQVVENAAADFAAWGALAKSAVKANPGVAFALQGGDIVESGIDRAQWDAFLANADAALGDIPFFPTNGNHESNFLSGKPELYLEMFDLPQNGPEGFKGEFYSFDYGDTHVLILNSWVFSGEQRLTEDDLAALDVWVADDLKSSDAAWKIAVTHVPLYPVHSDTTGEKARAHWAPLFEQYGVSLALVGHQHVYSRLKPLTDSAVDYENGVTYIMGNAGRKFYDAADESLAERTVYNTPTYQLVRVDGNSLTVQTFDGDGNELDYIALSPRAWIAADDTLTRGEFVAEYLDTATLLGYGDGNLGLGDAITNEQIATLLWRAAGEPAPQNVPVSGASDWARDAWAWAVERGIFSDAQPQTFSTRADAARALRDYANS
ncbi:MAG: metallophosphoesterase [Oscillospiraceae bacterium]|jgi:hypothetical protein|nr:metallophosphoesterase [Oscillospiraceae bacterium]